MSPPFSLGIAEYLWSDYEAGRARCEVLAREPWTISPDTVGALEDALSSLEDVRVHASVGPLTDAAGEGDTGERRELAGAELEPGERLVFVFGGADATAAADLVRGVLYEEKILLEAREMERRWRSEAGRKQAIRDAARDGEVAAEAIRLGNRMGMWSVDSEEIEAARRELSGERAEDAEELRLEVVAAEGLHARPHTRIVDDLRTLDAQVSVTARGEAYRAEGAWKYLKFPPLLRLCPAVRKGDTVTLAARGPDAAQALEVARHVLQSPSLSEEEAIWEAPDLWGRSK